jgi:tRNA pseudouridine38-40 synthase
MPAKRYKLTIAYDGTTYCGWQVQPNGIAVQQVIEGALEKLTGQPIKLHGSGRTDRGVHARGQVAHCDVGVFTQPRDLMRALNALLPADIRIMGADSASQDFHARKHAVGKQYRYQIWNGPVLPPHLLRYRTHLRRTLDVEAMLAAADFLVGRQDFASFTANPHREVESTVRNLTRLEVRKQGHEVVIIAEAEGFLYKMVRSLAGWLIRVGEGRVSADQTSAVLQATTRTAHVPSAPPQGLSLWRVWYQ